MLSIITTKYTTYLFSYSQTLHVRLMIVLGIYNADITRGYQVRKTNQIYQGQLETFMTLPTALCSTALKIKIAAENSERVRSAGRFASETKSDGEIP